MKFVGGPWDGKNRTLTDFPDKFYVKAFTSNSDLITDVFLYQLAKLTIGQITEYFYRPEDWSDVQTLQYLLRSHGNSRE